MTRNNDAIVDWGYELAALMAAGADRSALFAEGARNLINLLREIGTPDAREAADRIEAAL